MHFILKAICVPLDIDVQATFASSVLLIIHAHKKAPGSCLHFRGLFGRSVEF
jgi:hypothetical protein